MYRTDRNGSVRWDLVVEVIQQSPTPGTFPPRGGTTLIISTHGTRGSGHAGIKFLRYAIRKPLLGPEGRLRAARQRAYFEEQGLDPKANPRDLRVNFAFIHAEN
jgi:hypothetical protein